MESVVILTTRDLELIQASLAHYQESLYDAQKHDDGSYTEALQLQLHQLPEIQQKIERMLAATT